MRKAKQKELSLEPKWYVLELAITVVVSLIVSLLLVVIVAFIIKLANLDTGIIPLFVTIIKIISILVGCMFCLKRPNNGWLRGGLVGIVYIFLSFFVFSLLGSEFTFGLSLLNDTAIGMVAGVISGIIVVNLRKH